MYQLAFIYACVACGALSTAAVVDMVQDYYARRRDVSRRLACRLMRATGRCYLW